MHESADNWAHGTGRDPRDPRDPRDTQQREYPRTPPSEWKSYAQRKAHYSSQLDRDCITDLPRQQREEEDDDEEAYWSSVKTLYEKNPNCSRPRPVSRAHRPGTLDALLHRGQASPSLPPLCTVGKAISALCFSTCNLPAAA